MKNGRIEIIMPASIERGLAQEQQGDQVVQNGAPQDVLLHYQAALTSFNAVIHQAPHPAGSVEALADELALAASRYDRAHGINPNQVSAEAESALALRQQLQAVASDKAQVYYEQARLRLRQIAAAHYYSANVLVKLQRYSEAKKAFETSINLYDQGMTAHLNYSLLLEDHVGDLPAALVANRQAGALDPQNFIVFRNRAQLLLKLNQFDAAMHCIDQACSLDPLAMDPQRGWWIYDHLRAVAHTGLKHFKEAKFLLDTSIERNPHYVRMVADRCRLGLAYGQDFVARSNFHEAVKQFKAAIADSHTVRHHRNSTPELIQECALLAQEAEHGIANMNVQKNPAAITVLTNVSPNTSTTESAPKRAKVQSHDSSDDPVLSEQRSTSPENEDTHLVATKKRVRFASQPVELSNPATRPVSQMRQDQRGTPKSALKKPQAETSLQRASLNAACGVLFNPANPSSPVRRRHRTIDPNSPNTNQAVTSLLELQWEGKQGCSPGK
jgi:tetratricopeptide (TPR) repeat protein